MTDKTGLIKKMADSITKHENIDDACESMFNALGPSAKKAEMALELLFSTEPNELSPPYYINEGLKWLEDKLLSNYPNKI